MSPVAIIETIQVSEMTLPMPDDEQQYMTFMRCRTRAEFHPVTAG